MYTFHTVILLVNTLDNPRKHTMMSWQYINTGKASQCFIRGNYLIARKYILQLQSIFVIYGTRTWTLSSLFSRIAAQTTILSMVCYHCIHNFVAFESLDGGRTVFATFQLDRTADGLKMRNLRSDGRLTGAGVRISRTLSILHHLDLMLLTFGLILLPVILYPRCACIALREQIPE